MAEKKKPVKKTATAKPAAKAPKARAAKSAEAPQKATPAKSRAKSAAKAPAKRAVARPVTRTARVAEPKRRREQAPPPPPRVKAEPRPLPTAPAGQAALIGLDGAVAGSVALPEALVSAKRRTGVLFQAFVAQAANARQATASTKNRARVAGGGAKPWRQKGTGRSRQGSTRSPLWRHGGVAFGPNGRAYGQRLPEKMRKAAFAEAFAARAAEGRVLVFEGLAVNGDRPRTRTFVEWLGRIGGTGSTIVVTGVVDENVTRVARNVPEVTLRSVESLQLADLLSHDTLLVRRDALEGLALRGTVARAAAS